MSAVCSKPRERLPKWCSGPSLGLACGWFSFGNISCCIPRRDGLPSPPLLLAVVPEEPQAALLLPPRQCVPLWWCPEPALPAGQARAEGGQGRDTPVPSAEDGAKGCASLSEGT